MSPDTVSAMDLRQFIVQLILDAAGTYAADLDFITDDQFHSVPMGAARTPADFTAECIGFNRMVSRIVRGEMAHFPSAEEREAFLRSLNTIAKAQAALKESAETLASAVKGLSDSQMQDSVGTPWGASMPAFRMAGMAASHMSYHDGQINYIQSLYGDAQMHWG